MIQQDIFRILSEDVEIASYVGNRIYPIELPQGSSVPAIVYITNDMMPINSLDGESGLDSGLIEITCWAKTYMTAHLMAAAVRSAFQESGLGVTTDNLQDTQDEETRNYGVIMTMKAWSE